MQGSSARLAVGTGHAALQGLARGSMEPRERSSICPGTLPQELPLLGCVGIRWAGCAAGRGLLHICLVQRAVQTCNIEKHYQHFSYCFSSVLPSDLCRKK